MANRAYLYCTESVEGGTFASQGPYADSRRTIPLAWFFFFVPADIRRDEVRYGSARWERLTLVAPRGSALRCFAGRLPLLDELIGYRVAPDVTARFSSKVQGWAGRLLVVEPTEVLGGLGGDEAQHAAKWHRPLTELDRRPPRREKVEEFASAYTDLFADEQDVYEANVFGYTYS